jgi:ParB-like chromosome segregation protein Spo0J
MAEKKEAGVSKTTNFAVDPRIMEVEEGFNGRPIDPAHVRAIADSLIGGATLPPLEVRVENGRVIVVDGHHRREGALLAISEGAEIVALDCRQFRGNDADRVMLMITSQQGLPMTPLQLGVQYRKMLGFGWTASQIAKRCGKSANHVNDMIALAESNSDVQGMVTRGEVSATTALKVVKAKGQDAGKALAGHLEAAKAAGKAKVTPQVVAGWPKQDRVASIKAEIAAEDFVKAIKREIATSGEERVEDSCPAYADLVAYLRGTAKQLEAA